MRRKYPKKRYCPKVRRMPEDSYFVSKKHQKMSHVVSKNEPSGAKIEPSGISFYFDI